MNSVSGKIFLIKFSFNGTNPFKYLSQIISYEVTNLKNMARFYVPTWSNFTFLVTNFMVNILNIMLSHDLNIFSWVVVMFCSNYCPYYVV